MSKAGSYTQACATNISNTKLSIMMKGHARMQNRCGIH